MRKYQWSKLSSLQLGRYAEYLAKMEFTAFGFDVFTSEVDDKGIDFVVRKSEIQYYDVQVKSSRNMSYIFFPKHKFQLRPNLLAIVVLFDDDKPADIFILPSEVWRKPTSLFVSRDFKGVSKPEWGLNLSRKNLVELETYRFERIAEALK
jgi:hypothetical protein